MPSNKDTTVIRAIGIDTGKNTLHMVGQDEKGAVILREKVSRGRITARPVNIADRPVNVPPCVVHRRPSRAYPLSVKLPTLVGGSGRPRGLQSFVFELP